MAILVGQLIEILQKYDQDREVTIHTLKGETVEVNGYFVQRDLNDNAFYLTDLGVSEKESMITPENGFVLIETLEPGVSPLSVIEERDKRYEQMAKK